MFFPEGRIRVFLYGQPVDARKSFDGLHAMVKNVMGQDPLSGHLFAFVNRRGNLLKVLFWDRSGWCLWCKRLERGCFISDWRQDQTREMDFTGLKLLIEGLVIQRRAKRYFRPISE